MYSKIFVLVAALFLGFFVNPALSAQTVDINNADAATIAENLNGIGDFKAKAIVAYRTKHGVFVDEQDLVKVKGIGVKLIERNRSLISFGKNVSVKKPVVESPSATDKLDTSVSGSNGTKPSSVNATPALPASGS